VLKRARYQQNFSSSKERSGRPYLYGTVSVLLAIAIAAFSLLRWHELNQVSRDKFAKKQKIAGQDLKRWA
jgi:hypothetical protein